jgi:outer membrane protein OmpA-like peptidoglycan-associated protein
LTVGIGTVRSTPDERPAQRISLTLIEREGAAIVAHVTANAADAGADLTPTPFFLDAPTLMSDAAVQAYVRTAEAQSGQADHAYMSSLGEAALAADGIEAYERRAFEEALGDFTPAESATRARSLRTLNGIYLANWKLGRTADAQRAFGAIVARGIEQRDLGVKFLFEPATTDFITDRYVSGAYGMWLDEIAHAASRAPSCLQVVGHASHTGTEQANDALSKQRAQSILDRLSADAPGLERKATVLGVGFRENIVGIGTDDARDALDRRVAFKFLDCPGAAALN